MAIAPSAGAAAGATFGTLAFFLIFTLVAGRKGLLKFDPDEYMSARNSQGTFALTMSFFASGAGAWVLFTVPEAAILGGPIAVLGYALSCILPLLIYSWAAPYLRKNLPFGITFFEFVQARHGPLVNTYVTLVATFYMFLYLAAEFSSLGSAVNLLSSGGNAGLSAMVGTSLVTLLYTTLGGLPVSLITDRVQGVGVLVFAIFVVMGVLAFCLFPKYTDAADSVTAAANWQTVVSYGIGGNAGNSFKMAIVLILAVTSANLMHPGFQQRIWAAENNNAVKHGLWGASVLTIPFILLFGFFGMVAFAQFGFGGLVAPTYLAFLGAFFIIQLCPTGWQVLAIMLAVMMVASSADTLQSGFAGLFAPVTEKLLAALKIGPNPKLAMGLNLMMTLSLNILAIVLASQNISVLSLFVLADLLCATCCVPVLMGLHHKVHPHAALAGCIGGFVSALIIFGVGMPGLNEAGNFVMLLAPGGLYATTSFVAFIVVPVASGIITAAVSVPFAMKGYAFDGYPAAAPTDAESGAKPGDVTLHQEQQETATA